MPGSASPAMAMSPLSLTLASTPEAVRTALEQVVEVLSCAGIRPGACGMIELVIAESLNNIAEHAYRGSGTGEITLHLSILDGAVEVTLLDSGLPFPGGTLPSGSDMPSVSCTRSELPEGRFGWCLIRTLTSHLVYTRKDGRNRLCLRLDLDTLT